MGLLALADGLGAALGAERRLLQEALAALRAHTLSSALAPRPNGRDLELLVRLGLARLGPRPRPRPRAAARLACLLGLGPRAAALGPRPRPRAASRSRLARLAAARLGLLVVHLLGLGRDLTERLLTCESSLGCLLHTLLPSSQCHGSQSYLTWNPYFFCLFDPSSNRWPRRGC